MKRILVIVLKIIGLVLLNALLIAFSFWLYYGPTKEILWYTESLNDVEYWMILPFLLGLIFCFTVYKKFRYVGIGLTALCYSLSLFLLFFTNKQFASEGNYKTVSLYSARETKDAYFLHVSIYGWSCRVKVSPENCFLADSVKVRIDKGLFGMRNITQDVIIEETNNCEHAAIDSTHVLRSHSLAGGELAEKRCFSGAIFHYTQCIQLDSITSDFYLHRGLIYLVQKDYKNALIDILQAASLEYSSIKGKGISRFDGQDLAAIASDLKGMLERKEYAAIGENMDNLGALINLKSNIKLIKLCAEKLKEK
ncbi:MAG: hypothetical protein CFE21_15565 [Bacteroidetes bacterium B1(2017)]|nr:MAG: hypothetical protein CFE21_15565 [Bacteroidetes bacterium B1(2017)]